MGLSIFLFICWCSAFVLFSKVLLEPVDAKIDNKKVSVIIPARNEEKNIYYILSSLANQTCKPSEVIVVDDFSEDQTKEIAQKFDVTVIDNPPIPQGWTGKNWALWNGFKHSTGDILIFLDADVRLSSKAIEILVSTREKLDCVLSVFPFHTTEKLYERLSMITNILGVFSFTSPFERKSKTKGLFGACVVIKRENYEKINGHKSICSYVTDDLSLGKRFCENNIDVVNFIGYPHISFRMYPNGIISEIQGFAKSAALSMSILKTNTIFFIALWVIGLFLSGFLTPYLLLINHPLKNIFLIFYILYTIQIFYLQRYIGHFGVIIPVFHFISSFFFIILIIYSFYQVNFLNSVTWKGRQIKI